MIVQENNKYKLQPLGIKFVNSIIESDLFKSERDFLLSINKSVTEGKVNEVTKRWLENA